MAVTLIAIPKPFLGHTALIQRNAIKSWSLLDPKPEIILFGDDEGILEICAQFQIKHEPVIALNQFGTPLLNDIFDRTQKTAKNEVVCYVNADIVLMNDFMDAIENVATHFSRFLMVGQRWDADITDRIDFCQDWQENFIKAVRTTGSLHKETGIDYFVYSGDVFSNTPPFAIGRTTWDNWLIYHARSKKIPVIDATESVLAIHQNHDYTHHPQGAKGVWKGHEAVRNRALASEMPDLFTLRDATHILKKTRIKRAWDQWHFRRWVDTAGLFYPMLAIPLRIVAAALDISHPLRVRLGATLSTTGGHDRFWRDRTSR